MELLPYIVVGVGVVAARRIDPVASMSCRQAIVKSNLKPFQLHAESYDLFDLEGILNWYILCKRASCYIFGPGIYCSGDIV